MLRSQYSFGFDKIFKIFLMVLVVYEIEAYLMEQYFQISLCVFFVFYSLTIPPISYFIT